MVKRKKPTIVIAIDDDEENLELMKKSILNAGLKPKEFRLPKDAYKYLEDHGKDVDLILSAIQLKGMDGYEFVEKVKSDPDLKKIPFIFQSAYANVSDIKLALRSGADHYLIKPYSPDELNEVINKFGK